MNPGDTDKLLPAEPPVPAPVLHVGQVAVSQPVEAPGPQQADYTKPVTSTSGGGPVKMPLAMSAIPALAIGLLIVVMLLAVVAYAFFS